MAVRTTSREPVAPLTLEQEIRNLNRHSSCHHESDIRDEVVSEVLSILRKHGVVVETAKTESGRAACGFCGATEIIFRHKGYCIEL